mgnify:CR=1 FL=1
MTESRDAAPGDRGGSGFSALTRRRPVAVALAFESGLALLALTLALLFGLQPWQSISADPAALGQSGLGTALLVGAVLALMQARWQWVQNLERIVQDHLAPLFRGAGPTALGAVALAAGIGEELLFRGVIQDGLSGAAGPGIALLVASLLFGLAHAITPAYFVLASLMGLYLGGIYLATGNLLVPILVHFLYDWIVLSRYLAKRKNRR